MFCKNCGKEVSNVSVVCPYCGAPTDNFVKSKNEGTNSMAIAGFVLSFFIAILGLIFSIIGLKKVPETGKGKELAIAGIVISCISLFIWIIVIIAIVSAAGTAITYYTAI